MRLPSRPSKIGCALLMALALLTAAPSPAAAPTEYDVKAAYIYHFASFVEWPPEAFESRTSPIVVGVLGDGPLGPAVERTLRGKVARDRPLEVRRVTRPEEAARTHILVIEDSARDELPRWMQALDDRSVLTVADMGGFASRGGMVGFVVKDHKVRFEINLERAQQARVRISSQLLKLATLVPAN